MLELEKKEKESRSIVLKEQELFEMKYKSNIWKSYLFHLLMGAHFMSGIITIFFMTWGNLSFIEIMYLQSYFWIMILLFEIPCGAISDYFSRRFSLFLGGISTAIAAIVYSTIPHIGIFILAETLWAFGEALVSGTNSAMIYDTLKILDREEEMAKISGRNTSFFVAGIGIAAPIGSLLTLYIPIQYTFTIMFFPFVIGAIIALTLKEPNHDLRKESVKSESYIKVIKSGLKELKQNKNLRILAFDQVIVEGLIFLVFWTYQPYLGELGVLIVFFGFISSAMTVMQVLFINLVPKMIKKVNNKKRFLMIYTIIPGIAFVLLAIIRIPIVSIILFMIIVGFGISRSLIYVTGVNKIIKTDNRATVLSTINMMATFIKAILFPITGYLVMSGLSMAFIILGSVMVLLALFSRVKNEYLI